MDVSSISSKQTSEWIDSMKAALLESNADRAYWLTQNLPFSASLDSRLDSIDKDSLETLHVVKELISQAIDLLGRHKEDYKIQMDKIRKMRNFLL